MSIKGRNPIGKCFKAVSGTGVAVPGVPGDNEADKLSVSHPVMWGLSTLRHPGHGLGWKDLYPQLSPGTRNFVQNTDKSSQEGCVSPNFWRLKS